MRNCQEIYQTKSSNLIWNCFDIWNSGRKAKIRVKMTELKSSNLSVLKNCQEIYQTCFPATWFEIALINGIQVEKPKTELKWRNSSPATWVWMRNCHLPNQVQQLDLKLLWYMEFRSKSQKKSQNDGTQVQQFECERKIVKKFTKPVPATWFEIVLVMEFRWKANFRVKMTELKSSNLTVNELSFTKQVQQLFGFSIWIPGRKAKKLQSL